MATTTVAPVSRGTRIFRTVLLILLLPILLFYLLPRILYLVFAPDELDKTIKSAANYNPRLEQIIREEEGTLSALNTLDQIDNALARVRATVSNVDRELGTLIDQVRFDVQGVLNDANAEVADLLPSIVRVDDALDTLFATEEVTESIVLADRAAIQAAIDSAIFTAGNVDSAANDAKSAADSVEN